MSIREYKKGEHNGGFIGVRVVVKVGDDYRQKYFGFRYANTELKKETLRTEAKRLNAGWNMERELVQSRKVRDCREKRRVSSPFTTGVSGIKMKFVSNQKKRAGKVKRYYSPYFVVSGSEKGVRFDKTYSILKQGFDFAWFKAVEYYSGKKGMSSFSHLLERKPPVEQFFIIYKYQCSMGHDIPLRRMPDEIDEKILEQLK